MGSMPYAAMQLDNKGHITRRDINNENYPENIDDAIGQGSHQTAAIVPDTRPTKHISHRPNKDGLTLTSEKRTVGTDAGDCCLISVHRLELGDQSQNICSPNQVIGPLPRQCNGNGVRTNDAGTLSPMMSLNLEPNSDYLISNIIGTQSNSSHLSPSSLSFINISGSGCDNVVGSDKGSRISGCNLFCTNKKSRIRVLKRLFLNGLKYCVTYPLIILSLWAVLYILWGDSALLPGGTLFALIILEVGAIILGMQGYVSSWLALPHLTGMLVAGFILRNAPYVNVAKYLSLGVSSPLRGIAVVILLTRGAFGVNIENIRKFRAVVPFLAVGSCVIEAAFGSIAAFFIIGYSPSWAALIGCIMSAMSGVAVFPYLLKIESTMENDTSERTAVSRRTLVIAKTACGLDAILAICMAECAFGFIFAEEELEAGLKKGLAEVALGGAFGIFWGSMSGLLLSQKSCPELKTIAIFCGGVMSLIGLYKVGYPRGGPLGVFLGTFIAVNIWKWKKANLAQLTKTYDTLWFLFQPLLFGIIGARTDFERVDWSVMYKGVICLVICMTGRVIGSFLMTSWSDLPIKERVFLVIAWTGKGTVQAALGPVALDTAIDLRLEPQQVLAYQIMNLSTMTILISSIVGFLALRFSGHRILRLK